MRMYGAVLGFLLCLVAHACPPPWPTRPWAEVESILQAPSVASLAGFGGGDGEWWFSADGRFAAVTSTAGSERHARFGTYRQQGNWLETETRGSASDLQGRSPEERAEYEARLAEMLADEAQAGGVALPEPAPPVADEGALKAEEPVEYGRFRQRLLRLPYAGGEVLVSEQGLAEAANGWDGVAPLELWATAWRLPASAHDIAQQMPSVTIDAHARSMLPYEFARMLPERPLEARVAALVEDPAALEWHYGRATLHLRLDRGANAGVYLGMLLRGLAPDDDIVGRVVAVRPAQALLRVEYSRFAPEDAVNLPAPGLRLTARSAPPPPNADAPAMRAEVETARILSLPAIHGGDFAWVDVVLKDAQGLRLGDMLEAESDEVAGEGRVASIADGRASVRWRLMPFQLDWARAPAAGDALVTPAWKDVAEQTSE